MRCWYTISEIYPNNTTLYVGIDTEIQYDRLVKTDKKKKLKKSLSVSHIVDAADVLLYMFGLSVKFDKYTKKKKKKKKKKLEYIQILLRARVISTACINCQTTCVTSNCECISHQMCVPCLG